MGWNIVAEFVDRETGMISDRVEFQRCLRRHRGGSLMCCCFGVSTDCPVKARSKPCSIFNG